MVDWWGSAVQKIKKMSETPVTVHNIAKLCVIDGKNREITKKISSTSPPAPLLDPWEFQWENDQNGSFWAFWGVPKMALGVPESKF